MLGLFVGLGLGIGALVSGCNQWSREAESKERAKQKGDDVYVDHQGRFRLVSNDRVVYCGGVYINGECHQVMKDIKTGRILRDYTVENREKARKEFLENQYKQAKEYNKDFITYKSRWDMTKEERKIHRDGGIFKELKTDRMFYVVSTPWSVLRDEYGAEFADKFLSIHARVDCETDELYAIHWCIRGDEAFDSEKQKQEILELLSRKYEEAKGDRYFETHWAMAKYVC